MDNTNLPRPPWKEAVRRFLESGFEYGMLIPHDWFYDNFGLDQPRDDTPYVIAKQTQLEFVGYYSRFAEELKYEHHIHLDNVWGKGYRVVPPTEQTDWADSEGRSDLAKALEKHSDRLNYFNTDALDDAGRRERSDALARLGRLKIVLNGSARPTHRAPGEEE